jgi:hypothetical protein
MSQAALEVTVAADREQVSTGQTVHITVTVTNRSSGAKALRFPSSCQTGFEFLDATGKLVGAGVEMCAQSITSRTLEPGSSFTDSHEWGRRAFDAPQLSAGTYQLRGVLLATGDSVRSSPTRLIVE